MLATLRSPTNPSDKRAMQRPSSPKGLLNSPPEQHQKTLPQRSATRFPVQKISHRTPQTIQQYKLISSRRRPLERQPKPVTTLREKPPIIDEETSLNGTAHG